jgi:hypothetical protein
MRKIFALFFLTFLLGALPAFAWDDTGHKITTLIAWQRMTPPARAKAIELLSAAPEDSMILALLPSDSRSLAARQQQMFVTMSTWADLVRDERFPERRKEFHHGTWHYTDTFFRQNGTQIELVKDLKPDDENAVERLFEFEKVLGNAEKSKSDRGLALAWILHLAGDIHQPLHTVARVTPEEPKGDQGGNLFLLAPSPTPGGRPDNLHWYWDSIVSRNIARKNDQCDTDYLPRLVATFVKKHPAGKFAAAMKSGKYDEWQQEGFQIATREVYPPMLARNAAPPDAYRKRALAISEERLALAGYRIAELLNRILGS